MKELQKECDRIRNRKAITKVRGSVGRRHSKDSHPGQILFP